MDSTETMNMREVTVEVFTEKIKESLEDGDLKPFVGIGKSGVGKTESIYDLTKELGIGFCELRLVTMTETDMLGVPTVENGRTTWASNDLLPMASRDGERGILVLDEITSASSAIRAAAFQLLDSKRALGNYKLPDGWLIVALGNGLNDGGSYAGCEAAFLNRCYCFRIEPDLRTWKKWAVKSKINPSVIAYLSFEPSELHNFNPDEFVGVFPSPRSWAGLSRKLNDREARNRGLLDTEDVELYAACNVGNGVANKFAAFYKYNKSVINVGDILSGKASSDIGRIEPQVMHLIIENLVKSMYQMIKLNSKGFGEYSDECIKQVGNACTWLVGVSKHSLDMATIAFQNLRVNVPDFKIIATTEEFDTVCPAFEKFCSTNKFVFAPAKQA